MKSIDTKFGIEHARATACPPKILINRSNLPLKKYALEKVLAREPGQHFERCTHERTGLVTMNIPRRHIAHGCGDMVALPSKQLDNERAVGTKTISAVDLQAFKNTGP